MNDLAALLRSRLTWGVAAAALVAGLLANLNQLGSAKVFFVFLLMGLAISAPISLLLRRREDGVVASPVRVRYLGALVLFVAASGSLFLNPDFRQWLFLSEAELAASPGQERLVVEGARFERGDTDGDGNDDRLRVRFSTRNVGSGSALVDRVLIGSHPGPRAGGGNSTSMWLDGDVLAADVDGGTHIYTLAQRDDADDLYRLEVQAHVYYFGACGRDELVWVNASGEIPAREIREFEVNLPLQLRMREGKMYGAQDEAVSLEPGEDVELFLPQAEALPEMCSASMEGARPKYSLTVTTTGGQCRTLALDAVTVDIIEIEQIDDELDRVYFGGLCNLASDPHAAGFGIDPD
jgi:hypothetical protein